jgi:hypothetical protein
MPPVLKGPKTNCCTPQARRRPKATESNVESGVASKNFSSVWKGSQVRETGTKITVRKLGP